MLMVVMNSDVKDSYHLLVVAVLLPNFNAPLPPIIPTIIPGASPLVVDVMEHLTAQMEVMNETVTPVTTAEGIIVTVPHVYVQRDVMEDQSAMMEAMNKIVDQASNSNSCYYCRRYSYSSSSICAKRCNGSSECYDRSDEENCHTGKVY